MSCIALGTKIIILYDTTWRRPSYRLSISGADCGYQLQNGFQPTCNRER